MVSRAMLETLPYPDSMPELPEVETVARDLRGLLVGRSLVGVRRGRKALRQPWSGRWNKLVVGRGVGAVHRRGKWLLVELEGGSFLLVHLGMTGQFTVADPSAAVESHTHLVFALDNSHELRFRDIRRFGSVTYYAARAALDEYLAPRLGREPWDVPADEWRAALAATRRPIKAALLDQTIVAGVGNIYADEACFAAKIDPRRPANELKPKEAERLLGAVRTVLDRAIASRGSTLRDYVGGSGLRGEFQHEHAVYGRTGEPCLACGKPIERVRIGGRSTHFCARCQA